MIIKICGITSILAAEAAQKHGADIIGFVFAASRRQISASAAAQIASEIGGVAKAGVFVNQPLREVQEIADYCQLDFVQLHGDETPEYCKQLQRPIIKAFNVGKQFTEAAIEKYKVDFLLLDSLVSGQAGGTGTAFDWNHVRPFMNRLKQPILVAGGLNAENVAEAVKTLHPYGVDVSSGVETDGQKDGEKMRRFILAARAAERMTDYAKQHSG